MSPCLLAEVPGFHPAPVDEVGGLKPLLDATPDVSICWLA